MKNISLIGNMIEPEKPENVPTTGQWLGGRGAGSWFHITHTPDLQQDEFRVLRYIPDGSVMFDRVFMSKGHFDLDQPYRFVYDCHAAMVTIVQHDNENPPLLRN